MVDFGAVELELIQKYSGKTLEEIWPNLPPELRRLKCNTCKMFFEESLLVNGKCPVCGETILQKMCILDRDGCPHTSVMDGIEYCPICGNTICPGCGTHDVVCLSRVTGYYQDVSGWNAAKQQELRDRIHTNIIAS
jgi:hypothetical protein